MRLKDRVAVVTGGSRGVGKAVCLALAKEGCHVVVAAKTEDPNPKLPGTIHDTVKEIEALGRRGLGVKCDVRDEASIARMVDEAKKAFGQVDILVNNAGALYWADVATTPVSKFDLVMGVNARAAFLASREVLPGMLERKWGHIVMMSPPIRFGKLSGKVGYMLSKMGMTFVARGLAEEVADQGVSCNALWPMTLVESYATINFGMGEPAQWRKAEVLADATVEICCTPPGQLTGQELYDEAMLRRAGVTDFSRYQCVPGSEPGPLSRDLIE